jgi:Putative beta-barrel porin-2, OmpL-like. bbp2
LLKQSTLAGAILALGLLGFSTAAALAQTSPTPSPTPAAKPAPAASATPAATPTPSPTPYKLITLQGSGDAGYTSVNNTTAARFVTGGPSRVFDVSTGPFFDANGGRQLAGPNDFNKALDLQNLNLSATLNGPFISAKFEGSFGSDADVIASNGQSRSGANLTQAYLQAVKGNGTLIVGKFETLAGAEYIEAPLNTNYSRSYLFGYAIPFTHTGARFTYVLSPKFTIVAGANNGWDDWKFAGKKKTIEGALLMTLSPAVTWNVQTYNGNDFAVSGNSVLLLAPTYTNRMLYDSELSVKATSSLTLIANYDNGTQLADNGALFPASAHWNGLAGYANYAFTPVYGISLRKETFGDPQGFRTGIPQRLQSNTATFNYTPGSNYIFRAEYRLDSSSANSFTFANNNGVGRDHQASIGLEAVVKFP